MRACPPAAAVRPRVLRCAVPGPGTARQPYVPGRRWPTGAPRVACLAAPTRHHAHAHHRHAPAPRRALLRRRKHNHTYLVSVLVGGAQVGRGQLNGTGGTGLGLGIVRQLLALHDSSELALSSGGRNKGTSFELVLNLQGARVDPPSVAASDGHARTGLASGARTPDASESESLHALTSALLSHQSKRRPGKARAQTLASVPAKSSAIGGTSIAAAAEKVRMRPGAAASGSQLVQARRHGVMEDGESDTDSIYGGLGGLGTGTGGFGSPATTNRTEVRCLYVEDDKFLQLTIPGRIFLPLGVGYDSAEDGKRAVEMVLTEGRKYDCIVMDNQVRDCACVRPRVCASVRAATARGYGAGRGRWARRARAALADVGCSSRGAPPPGPRALAAPA